MHRLIIAIFLAFIVSNCIAQVNFKRDYLESNPLEEGSNLKHASQIELHEAYLHDAVIRNDTLKQIYGLFHLFSDYTRTNNFIEQKKIILSAQKLINENSKPEWQGAMIQRTAYLTELLDKNTPLAIIEYQRAVKLCKEAKDSLCIAESLEQLSNLNKNVGNYELAENYFYEAIIMLEKHATLKGLALAYNNYCLLAQDQGKLNVAEEYIDRAIAITKIKQDTFNTAVYVSNKALVLLKKERYQEAIELYREMEEINERNSWTDNLVYNYIGLASGYESIGEFQKSNIYLQKYYELKEALSGPAIQKKIHDLEMKERLNHKELILNKKENQLQKSKQQRDRLIGIATLLTLLCFGLYYFWRMSKKNSLKEKEDNLNYIQDLKKILMTKNNEIKAFSSDSGESNERGENKLPEKFEEPENDSDQDFKVFDSRIINDEGITAFKSYFDKIYPSLLISVRSQWPNISDAEERLFMLIKLRIKSKEASEILGISLSSVKKSRYRLRKRLDLDSSIDLEQFVLSVS